MSCGLLGFGFLIDAVELWCWLWYLVIVGFGFALLLFTIYFVFG